MSETLELMATEGDQKRRAEQLPAQAKEQGVELVGPYRLLNELTKNMLEIALDAQMIEHFGYGKHDPVGLGSDNSRNGTRATTVFTEIGPVEIEVTRDTNCSFAPQIVKERQRLGLSRLNGPSRQRRLAPRSGESSRSRCATGRASHSRVPERPQRRRAAEIRCGLNGEEINRLLSRRENVIS